VQAPVGLKRLAAWGAGDGRLWPDLVTSSELPP
jgi:hypothetical protein